MLKVLQALTLALILTLSALAVHAAVASKLVIIVGYPAGGSSDLTARLIANGVNKATGATVIVENRPGANGLLGLGALAQAAPDGGTISLIPASVTSVNPWIYKMPVDVEKGITPITLVYTVANVLIVSPTVPVKSLEELIAHVKRTRGVSYASMGIGSSGHLNGELFVRSTGLEMTHVPYKGSPQAFADLMGGNVQLQFANLTSALQLIKAGKVRALAVTSAAPSPLLPDVPPMNRTVPGFEDDIWFGFIGPAGLSGDTLGQLNKLLGDAIRSPEFAKAMLQQGITSILPTTPEEMRKRMDSDRAKWGRVVKEANIKAQ